MKQSLPSLAWLVALALGATALAQNPAAPPALPAPAGQDLVVQAARRLYEEQSLECKIRYRVKSFGHELVGQGVYMQIGPRERQLLRLELKMQVGGQIASLQQICGEEYLWIRRDLPQGKHELSRVSLRQYREAAAAGKGESPPLGAATGEWLMMGGLARLLESLNRCFEFEAPRAGMLQSVPVWVVGAHWRPEPLKVLLEGRELPLDKLPEQFPARVELTLGRDQIMPLFPYRVEWLRQVRDEPRDKSAPPSEPRWEPLVIMELYEASRHVSAGPSKFEYDPGDQEVADVTAAYLAKAGLKATR